MSQPPQEFSLITMDLSKFIASRTLESVYKPYFYIPLDIRNANYSMSPACEIVTPFGESVQERELTFNMNIEPSAQSSLKNLSARVIFEPTKEQSENPHGYAVRSMYVGFRYGDIGPVNFSLRFTEDIENPVKIEIIRRNNMYLARREGLELRWELIHNADNDVQNNKLTEAQLATVFHDAHIMYESIEPIVESIYKERKMKQTPLVT